MGQSAAHHTTAATTQITSATLIARRELFPRNTTAAVTRPSTGTIGGKTVKNDPPALILLDVMMEPMDGWEFLEKIRSGFGMKDLPVILFTAFPTVEERFATMHDTHLGVLQKPVSIADLKAGLEKFLQK